MIKNSRVAIIIVNWKKYTITSKCIESVFKCNYSNYEIILVDNESDGSKLSTLKRKNITTISNSKTCFKSPLIIFLTSLNLGYFLETNI